MINQQLKDVIYDTFSLLQTEQIKIRYKNPALTKNCLHRNSCFEMEVALSQIQQNQFFQCPHCKLIAKSPADLVEDWRVKAYLECNSYVEDVTIIKGIVINKYIRNKVKYLNFFNITEYANEFQKMFERVTQENSINSMIQKELIQQKSDKQNKINFWSFCLQDRVKINIPVRILGCKHYECYELTSLLFFQEQNRKKKEFLDCNQPGCSNRLRIAHKDYTKQAETPNTPQIEEQEKEEKIIDIQTLFSGICVDLDLLNAIKLSNPSSYKFYYNKETGKIQEDIKIENGNYVDPFIQAFYQQRQDLKAKISFEEFQKQIQQSAMSVSQGDLLQDDKQLGKQITLYRYRNYKVKMQDQFTQLTIEYPVRCKYCTDLQVCMDMRSYIADFNYQKKINPTQTYRCPLCKKPQNGQMFKAQIQNYIYLDSNMLSYMFKDMSYTNGTKVFEYQGEQYMLQEFMDRQKIKREVYIKNKKERQVVFKQLFCIVNNNQRIKQPLFLQNCPKSNIVDFKSFYEELKKIEFDYENQGLILCKCDYCNSNPIKSLVGNIYFHEAFYEALNKYYKLQNPENDKEFTYKFADSEQESMVVQQMIPTNNPKIKVVQKANGVADSTNLRDLKGEDGFLDLMNDEEYQKLFVQTKISGFEYKAQRMTQDIGGVKIEYKQDGIHANVKDAVDKYNKDANQDLKKYSFSVLGMSVELNNDIIKQSKGQFEYTNLKK